MRLRVRKRAKYLNQKTDGYDSKAEARVGGLLEVARRARAPSERVVEILRQERYELLPAQLDAQGAILEHAVSYVADFTVSYADGRTEVIDVKSEVTRRLPAYIIKRKLMLYRYGVRVREWSAGRAAGAACTSGTLRRAP